MKNKQAKSFYLEFNCEEHAEMILGKLEDLNFNYVYDDDYYLINKEYVIVGDLSVFGWYGEKRMVIFAGSDVQSDGFVQKKGFIKLSYRELLKYK